MALVFMDGFDMISDTDRRIGKWGDADAGVFYSNTPAFGSGGCMVIGGGIQSIQRNLDELSVVSALSYLCVGFWAKMTLSSDEVMTIMDISDRLNTTYNAQASLKVSDDQHVLLTIDNSTELGSDTSNVALDVYHHYELRWEKSAATLRTIGIWRDGNELITIVPGSDTISNSRLAGDVTIIRFGHIEGAPGIMEIDDVYCLDDQGELSGGLNQPYIETVFPNADGTVTEWATTETARYCAVSSHLENNGYEAAKFLNASLQDAKMSFEFSGVSAPSSVSVHVIQLTALARKNTARTTAIDFIVMPSGTSAHAVCHFLGLSAYVQYTNKISDNPDNSTSWAISELDVMSAGFVVGAGTT